MEHFKDSGVMVNDIKKHTNQYPDICVTKNNETWIVYQQYLNKEEKIFIAKIEDKKNVIELQVSEKGLGLRPRIYALDNQVWAVWSEFDSGYWYIKARYYEDQQLSRVFVVDKGEALFYPSISSYNDKICITYNNQSIDVSDVILAYIEGDKINKEQVSNSGKSYRPSLAVDRANHLYVAYDVYNGKTYDIVVKALIDGVWSDELQVSENHNFASHPVITNYMDKTVVCWYEFGALTFIGYYSCDVFVVDKAISKENYTVIVESANWYNNVDIATADDGTVAFVYNWGKYNSHVRLRIENDVWSEPTVITYKDGACAVRPKITFDRENNLQYVWQFSHKNGHMPRFAVTIYNWVTIADILNKSDSTLESIGDMFIKPIMTPKALEKLDEATNHKWLKKNGYDHLTIKWGDIHGQSNMSDGLGEIDQYYHYGKVQADLAYVAMTDHDNYPDIATSSEWEWNRTTCRLFNTQDFAALLAFEWTSNEYKYDFGHKNVYYRGDTGNMHTSVEQDGMTPDRLFASIKLEGGQCIPHHVAADWKLVSAATDWDYYDGSVQRVSEIMSRHGVYEKYEDMSDYTKNIAKVVDCCVQDALARKIRLGFICGSDSHQMEHGIEGGIMAAFIPKLKREDIYDALYNRFVYGTTGARILMSLKVNNQVMGSEITIAENSTVVIAGSVLGAQALKCVQVIKNNQVFASFENLENEKDFVLEDSEVKQDDYYYMRVEQVDNHLGWCSPIFIDIG